MARHPGSKHPAEVMPRRLLEARAVYLRRLATADTARRVFLLALLRAHEGEGITMEALAVGLELAPQRISQLMARARAL